MKKTNTKKNTTRNACKKHYEQNIETLGYKNGVCKGALINVLHGKYLNTIPLIENRNTRYKIIKVKKSEIYSSMSEKANLSQTFLKYNSL